LVLNNLVYIIYSKLLDKYYVGETIDLGKRLIEHNNGTYDKAFTKKANDWSIFLLISCDDKKQALLIEKHIKRMKSRVYIENLKKYPLIVKKLKDKYTS
jgi:putative endonuclease